MSDWFNDKELARSSNESVNLTDHASSVRDFMERVEGKCEIHRAGYAKRVFLATLRVDSITDARLASAFLQHIEHLLLQIDGNHMPLVTDNSGHGYGEETHPAADVHIPGT